MDFGKIDLVLLREFALGRRKAREYADLIKHKHFGFLRQLDNIFFIKIITIYLRGKLCSITIIESVDFISITPRGQQMISTKQFEMVFF